MERKSAWKNYGEDDLGRLESVAAGYIDFISRNKTERECAANAIEMARAAGYVDLEEIVAKGEYIKPGDKVYAQTHGKSVILLQMGKKPLSCGMNILGAHIDSPRLDVKQNPLYESADLALLDTHYYGGVKKYQWVAVPMALHGVVAKTDGSVVDVVVGEDPLDPVFCISDLLIHLSAEQLKKDGATVVEGEQLDLIVGGRPAADPQEGEGESDEKAAEDKKDPVKHLVLQLLEEKYGIAEEDFVSAELEVVPAGPAREMGFDRSMVLGYGQDDRVCAYTSLIAQLELANRELERSSMCVLVDKEEIGSVGATGMQSLFFENTVAEVLFRTGEIGCESTLALRRALKNSRMLSSDVSAGFDPGFPSVFETKNAAYLGRGVVFNKYTGSRGKGGSNDASAEYVALVRRIMDDAGVAYQTAELGRVDAGGGGTIAYIPANYDMDVIDSGVAVLSMHAPWEITNKADIYEAYRCYVAFAQSE